MTIVPDEFGPRRCGSKFRDSNGIVVPCGYDEFHTLHEDELGTHRAYSIDGQVTHVWQESNVAS